MMNVSDLLFVVLNPDIKLTYTEDKWNSEARQDAVVLLEEAVHILYFLQIYIL